MSLPPREILKISQPGLS